MTKKNQNFWGWYLSGWGKVLSFKWVSSSISEMLLGSFLFGASLILGLAYNTFFFLLALSAIIPWSHAVWRLKKEEEID